MQGSEGLSLDEEIQRAIVDASAFVVTEICSVLRSSSTPGRQHYVFSMNDILRSYKVNNSINNFMIDLLINSINGQNCLQKSRALKTAYFILRWIIENFSNSSFSLDSRL